MFWRDRHNCEVMKQEAHSRFPGTALGFFPLFYVAVRLRVEFDSIEKKRRTEFLPMFEDANREMRLLLRNNYHITKFSDQLPLDIMVCTQSKSWKHVSIEYSSLFCRILKLYAQAFKRISSQLWRFAEVLSALLVVPAMNYETMAQFTL